MGFEGWNESRTKASESKLTGRHELLSSSGGSANRADQTEDL